MSFLFQWKVCVKNCLMKMKFNLTLVANLNINYSKGSTLSSVLEDVLNASDSL